MAAPGKGLTSIIFHEINDLDEFEVAIEVLSKNFDFFDPQNLSDFLDGKVELKRNNLLVTFDDGFLTSYEAAKRSLVSRNIKSLFFICPSFIGTKGTSAATFVKQNLFEGLLNNVDPAQLPMSWEQLKELADNGNLIGSHTMTHPRLSKISGNELRLELESSKIEIQSKINRPVECFAWPFGDINSINQKSLTEIKKHYKFCFSGVRGNIPIGASPYILNREEVSLSEGLNPLILNCYNGLAFTYKKQRELLSAMVN